MGSWLLFFAYMVSVVGCVVGLACTLQARHAGDGRQRVGWLVAAAISIGGVGIWLMHFIAMLGFDTPGSPVRYDIGRTALSAALSIAATFVGLVVFGVGGRFSVWRLLTGGVIMGLAVNLMHYTGMWAVQIQGTIDYDAGLVWLSIAIAVVAATAALWFTVLFDSITLRIVAGLIMGVAVTGMHYTGMAAVRVTLNPSAPPPDGAEVFTFLFPVFVFAVIALAIPIYAVLMASTWQDNEAKVIDDAEAVPAPSAPRLSTPRHATHAMGQGVRGVHELANRYVADHKPMQARSAEQEQPSTARHAEQGPIESRRDNQEPLPTRRPAGR